MEGLPPPGDTNYNRSLIFVYIFIPKEDIKTVLEKKVVFSNLKVDIRVLILEQKLVISY